MPKIKVQFCYLRLYLCIEIVSCRLLQPMTRMEMDWNLKKLAQLVQVLMVRLQKSPKKLLWLICLKFSSQLYTGAFYVWVKAKTAREQSFLFYRFSEGGACARERRAAKSRDARNEGAPVSRLQSRAWSFACLTRFEIKNKGRLLVV